MRGRYRYPSSLLFRRIINLVIRPRFSSKFLRQRLRQRRRQGRLTMVYVSYRPYVYMRLRSLKYLLAHFKYAPLISDIISKKLKIRNKKISFFHIAVEFLIYTKMEIFSILFSYF